MQDFDPKAVKTMFGDTILVKMVEPPLRTGSGFYIPANVADNMKKARKRAWEAEIVKWGPEAILDGEEKPKRGMSVYVAPVAKQCPQYETPDGKTFFFIKAEDVIAEVIHASR